MSDEKNNVVYLGGNKQATDNVLELDKYDNLKQLIEKSIGSKHYVFCYINEDGSPCILPSEEVETMEMVFLAELMKTIAMSNLGFQALDEE